MLSRGFKDQIYDVFRKLPSNTQVILLSATMPDDVLEVTKRFMRDPIRILVKKEELTLEGIKQFYVQVEKEVRVCVYVCACVRACVRACVHVCMRGCVCTCASVCLWVGVHVYVHVRACVCMQVCWH